MDPKLRRSLAKEGRLWLLGVICAVPGAIAANRYDSWWVGAGVFAACLVVLGPVLYWYEKRRRARATPSADPRTGPRSPAQTPTPAPSSKPASVNQRYGQRKRTPGSGRR